MIEVAEGVRLPRPGAPLIDNLCATLILAGNRSTNLKLDVIAAHQGLDAGDFRARFAEIETAHQQTMWKQTTVPVGFEDGK